MGVRLVDSEEACEVNNHQGAPVWASLFESWHQGVLCRAREPGDSSQSSLVWCCTERGSWTGGKSMRRSCLVMILLALFSWVLDPASGAASFLD